MPKSYTITQEDAAKAREYMKKTTDKKIYRRLEVIALRGEGQKNAEIVKITGFAEKYVPQIVSMFVREGFDALLQDKRSGNNRKVTAEEEQKFLNRYKEKSQQGQIITVNEMWQDFQKEFSTTITIQAFYRLLRRNKWRKIMPRARHPKSADAQTIEASKKSTLKSKR